MSFTKHIFTAAATVTATYKIVATSIALVELIKSFRKRPERKESQASADRRAD